MECKVVTSFENTSYGGKKRRRKGKKTGLGFRREERREHPSPWSSYINKYGIGFEKFGVFEERWDYLAFFAVQARSFFRICCENLL